MNNDIKFHNIEWRTSYPLTDFEGRFGLRASVIIIFFRLHYVWFPVHLCTGWLPNSSDHLTELIVHIIRLE